MPTSTSRREFLRYTVAGSVALFASACAPVAPSSPAQGDASAVTVPITAEVTELVYFDESAYPEEHIAALVDAFEEVHPEIKLNFMRIPFNDLEPKIVTLMASDEPLDVFYTHEIQSRTYILRGVLKSVDDRWEQLGVPEDDWFPAIHAFDYRGKTWGVPNVVQPATLGYNPELLDSAGLKTPTELEAQGQWTLEVFNEYIEKLTTGEGQDKVFGCDWIWNSLRVGQAMWIWGHGGNVYAQDESETLINRPEAVQAWEQMASYYWNGWTPAPGELADVSPAAKWERTAMGQLARLSIVPFLESGEEPPFRMMPLPVMPTGTRDHRLGVSGIGIFSKSKHVDEAFAYARWRATDGHPLWVRTGWTFPIRKSELEGPEWAEAIQEPYESNEVYRTALENGRWIPMVFRAIELDTQYIQPTWEQILLQQISVQEGMDQIKPEIDAVLQEAAAMPLPEN